GHVRRRKHCLLRRQRYFDSQVLYIFDNRHFGADGVETGAVSQQLYIHAALLRTLSIGVLMRDLLNCRRGSVAFATVIALVPLIGVVALGAEAGTWYVTRQQAQNAADAAAYSGALSLACTISGATCAH